MQWEDFPRKAQAILSNFLSEEENSWWKSFDQNRFIAMRRFSLYDRFLFATDSQEKFSIAKIIESSTNKIILSKKGNDPKLVVQETDKEVFSLLNNYNLTF